MATTKHGFALQPSAPSFAPAAPGSASSGEQQQLSYFRITVHYTRPCDAHRALGYLLGIVRSSLTAVPLHADVEMQNGVHPEKEQLHPGLYSVAPSSSPLPSASPSSASSSSSGGAYTRPHKRPAAPPSPGSGPQQRWVLDAPAIVSARLQGRAERCSFETLGTMIDCSRNGVLRVSSVKFLLRKLALLGYNMLQLYTEDTYEIRDEPFFGYLRGAYTEEEMREIDDYAFSLGIEVIPCSECPREAL